MNNGYDYVKNLCNRVDGDAMGAALLRAVEAGHNWLEPGLMITAAGWRVKDAYKTAKRTVSLASQEAAGREIPARSNGRPDIGLVREETDGRAEGMAGNLLLALRQSARPLDRRVLDEMLSVLGLEGEEATEQLYQLTRCLRKAGRARGEEAWPRVTREVVARLGLSTASMHKCRQRLRKVLAEVAAPMRHELIAA